MHTGVSCYSLLQGIFLTQGLNLGLLHCRQYLALQADSLLTEPSGKAESCEIIKKAFNLIQHNFNCCSLHCARDLGYIKITQSCSCP